MIKHYSCSVNTCISNISILSNGMLRSVHIFSFRFIEGSLFTFFRRASMGVITSCFIIASQFRLPPALRFLPNTTQYNEYIYMYMLQYNCFTVQDSYLMQLNTFSFIIASQPNLAYNRKQIQIFIMRIIKHVTTSFTTHNQT